MIVETDPPDDTLPEPMSTYMYLVDVVPALVLCIGGPIVRLVAVWQTEDGARACHTFINPIAN